MPWTRAASAMSTPKRCDVLVAGVRTGAGHDGAGDDRRARSAPASAHVSRRVSVVDDRARAAVGLARPPQQHDGDGDEDLRQQHVALHGQRVEVDEHGDAAEHDLAEDAGDEAERQPREVAPARLGAAATRARRR